MKKTQWIIKRLAPLLAGALLLGGCSGLSGQPPKTVTLTVWHYYNGDQQLAFDQMVQEFNETIGLDEGIAIEGVNQGSIGQLMENLLAAANKEVGSMPLPDVTAAYADTAYELSERGLLVDLDQYITPEELSSYVDGFIEEGRIGPNGELFIFPTAKSTEVLMVNKTDWDVFAADTGAQISGFDTMESCVELARQYYEWTDAKTPEVANDGKALFGRDSQSNLFLISLRQMGVELFEVKNGEVQLNLDRTAIHRVWENFYVPHLQGYFTSSGKFRSDAAKVGDLIALVGSSSSASYFPNEVVLNSDRHQIEAEMRLPPLWQGCQAYAVQQGAGMTVFKSEERNEQAAALFLKWFTEAERNLRFSSMSGYVPVKKEALKPELLEELRDAESEMSDAVYQTLRVSMEVVNTRPLYTPKPFRNGNAARKVLDTHLSDRIEADLLQVHEKMALGMSREEAIAPFVTDEAFDFWFADFSSAMEEALKG